MRGMFVDLVRNLRDTVRARRQEALREVELTWSDHDLDNFRVFALGLQPAEMADVCYALADATALPLMELLADYAESNDDLRPIAFQPLNKAPVSARLSISKRLLSSVNPLVKAAACDMLAGVGSAAVESLAESLSDRNSLVSTAAIRGLVKVGGRGAGEKIAGLLQRNDPDICSQALNAMIKMGIPASVFENEALAIFHNEEFKPELRKTALRALASGQSKPGRELMFAILNGDGDLDMRRAAAETLGNYHDEEAARLLLKIASSSPPLLAVIASQALSLIDERVKLKLFAREMKSKDVGLVAMVASFLGEMESAGAEKLLYESLDSETRPDAVVAIADSLGKSGFPEAWERIYKKLLGDDYDSIALLASLADATGEDRLDDFARLIEFFPGGAEAEFILRRLAAFARAGKTSAVAEEKAREAIDIGNRAMSVPAVEILALSGRKEGLANCCRSSPSRKRCCRYGAS